MTRMAMALADPNQPDCPLVYVNPAFADLTGYTAEEVVGRNCRFLQGPQTDPAMVARIRHTVAASETFNEEIYNYRKDGSGFWNALHLSPVFDEQGRLIYYFASQIDVSFKKEAARRQAQRMASMHALSLGVAHEFNNLMTVVSGNVERATRHATDERQERYLDRAIWGARRAGLLAAKLVSLSERQIGCEEIADLNTALLAIGDRLARSVGERVRLRMDLAPGLIPVRLDFHHLEAALLNVVYNAADAAGGNDEIVVATNVLDPAQAASALNTMDAVELTVTDSGAGMLREVAERATELFFTTKRADGNIGLGLFLVLAFVDECGGKLSISSEPGRGTTIRMIFPKAT